MTFMRLASCIALPIPLPRIVCAIDFFGSLVRLSREMLSPWPTMENDEQTRIRSSIPFERSSNHVWIPFFTTSLRPRPFYFLFASFSSLYNPSESTYTSNFKTSPAAWNEIFFFTLCIKAENFASTISAYLRRPLYVFACYYSLQNSDPFSMYASTDFRDADFTFNCRTTFFCFLISSANVLQIFFCRRASFATFLIKKTCYH